MIFQWKIKKMVGNFQKTTSFRHRIHIQQMAKLFFGYLDLIIFGKISTGLFVNINGSLWGIFQQPNVFFGWFWYFKSYKLGTWGRLK